MTPLERATMALYGARVGNPDYDGAVSQADLEQVRAVLTAIREPTHAMQAAAFAEKVSFRSGSGMSDIGQVSVEYEGEDEKGAATLWRAMIDAMLEEG